MQHWHQTKVEVLEKKKQIIFESIIKLIVL